MIVWGLLFPPERVIFASRDRIRQEKGYGWIYLLYAMLALATFGWYFAGYHRPSHHPSFLVAFSQPANAIRYFLIWLGSPLMPKGSYFGIRATMIIGGILLATFTLIISMSIFSSWNAKSLFAFYPWFILGCYTVLNGLVTTLGRVGGWGINQARSSRYTTFSIYLSIAVLVSMYLFYVIYVRGRCLAKEKKSIVFQSIAVILLLCLHIHAYSVSLKYMKHSRRTRKTAKSALQFSNIIFDEEKLRFLHWNRQHLFRMFTILSDYGLFDIKLIDRTVFMKSLEELKLTTKEQEVNGRFEKCMMLENHTLQVSGWAKAPQHKTPAKQVVLVYTNQQDISFPFALVPVRQQRLDIVQALQNPLMVYSGFHEVIELHNVPDGELIVSAWTVDERTSMAYQLGKTFRINIVSPM